MIMTSIADKLSLLLDPTPSADPEDENEDTSARLVDKADLDADDPGADEQIANKSKLRNPISAICFEEKYAGKVVSRIDNLDDFSDDGEQDDDEDIPQMDALLGDENDDSDVSEEVENISNVEEEQMNAYDDMAL